MGSETPLYPVGTHSDVPVCAVQGRVCSRRTAADFAPPLPELSPGRRRGYDLNPASGRPSPGHAAVNTVAENRARPPHIGGSERGNGAFGIGETQLRVPARAVLTKYCGRDGGGDSHLSALEAAIRCRPGGSPWGTPVLAASLPIHTLRRRFWRVNCRNYD